MARIEKSAFRTVIVNHMRPERALARDVEPVIVVRVTVDETGQIGQERAFAERALAKRVLAERALALLRSLRALLLSRRRIQKVELPAEMVECCWQLPSPDLTSG